MNKAVTISFSDDLNTATTQFSKWLLDMINPYSNTGIQVCVENAQAKITIEFKPAYMWAEDDIFLSEDDFLDEEIDE